MCSPKQLSGMAGFACYLHTYKSWYNVLCTQLLCNGGALCTCMGSLDVILINCNRALSSLFTEEIEQNSPFTSSSYALVLHYPLSSILTIFKHYQAASGGILSEMHSDVRGNREHQLIATMRGSSQQPHWQKHSSYQRLLRHFFTLLSNLGQGNSDGSVWEYSLPAKHTYPLILNCWGPRL